MGRHPEWAGALAGVLGRRLDRPDLPASERTDLEKQLGRLAQAPPIQDLLADRLKNASAPRAARQSSLQALAWSGLNEKQVPASWILGLATTLDQKPADAELLPLAVVAARALPLPQARAESARHPPPPDRLRLEESRRASLERHWPLFPVA